MKIFAVVLSVVWCFVFSGEEAKAQWLLAPPPMVQMETWHQVKITHVGYCVGGVKYVVDNAGGHWRCDDQACIKIRQRFVEPFDQFGCRIPKVFVGLPVGAESTFQVGVKTHVIAGGKTYIGSWVQMECGRIVPVWLEIQLPQAAESLPTPAEPTLAVPKLQPTPEIIIPSRRNDDGPLLPPALPSLEVPPQPTEGASQKKATPVKSRRRDGPVA